MKKLTKSAQLTITSYDKRGLQRGYDAVLSKSSSEIKIGKPKPQKVVLTKDSPKIWGCKGTDLKRVSVSIAGSMEDIEKLTAIDTIEGVYIRLLVSEE